MSANSVSGHEDNSSCSAANSSASAGLVELTVTPETLDDFNYQIYIDGSVEAKFEGVANLDQGSASATGGAASPSRGRRAGPRSFPASSTSRSIRRRRTRSSTS